MKNWMNILFLDCNTYLLLLYFHLWLLINFQNEAVKKRDMDIQKLRKDLEVANLQLESVEQGLRKKYNSSMSEMSSEIENLQKVKGK